MGRGKNQYGAVLRARVPESFKERLRAIIDHRGHGDISDLVREAVSDYLLAEEGVLMERIGPPQGGGHVAHPVKIHPVKYGQDTNRDAPASNPPRETGRATSK